MLILSRSLQTQTITVPPASAASATSSVPGLDPGSSRGTTHKSNTGAIVGGVAGGLVGLALAVLAMILFRRRRSHHAPVVERRPRSMVSGQPEPYLYTRELSRSAIDTRTEDRPQVRPSIAMLTGEKNRLHFQNLTSTTTAAPTVSTPISFPASSSIHDPPSTNQQSLIAPTEVRELRTEMENLRRVMQQIGVDNNEPPPTYIR